MPRPAWSYFVAASGVVTFVALSGCQPSGDQHHPPNDSTSSVSDPNPSVETQQDPLGRAAECVDQSPRRVSLRGRIHSEVHLGPPGYGETPTVDTRDTILVLALPRTIALCNDPRLDPQGASAIDASSVQLVGHVGRNHRAGDTITAYGSLIQRTWGRHYLPVVLEVDSIAGQRANAVGDGVRAL